MAVVYKNIVPCKNMESSQTTQYTATNTKAVVDSAVITNTTSGNLTVSVNVVPVSGSAAASNKVLDARTITPHETYGVWELVGRVIENGGFISTIASATGLTLCIDGREGI
jgi:hypothetical protein